MTRRPPQPRLGQGRPARRGYVLLLTLLILTLAATVLAGVVRRSLERSRQSRVAAEELQRRWGVLTCRASLLPEAGRLLADAEAAEGRAVPRVRASLTLGGQSLDLTFADEQAKADVNVLLGIAGKAGAEAALKRLLRASGLEARPKLLAGGPRRERAKANAEGLEDEAADPSRPLQSLGQVFPGLPPDRLAPSAFDRDDASSPASLATCWGDGRLHFRRASHAAMREVCSGTLKSGDASRLIAARDADPEADVLELAEKLALGDDALLALDDLFTDVSLCHSLWIVSRSGQRSWYHLAIADESAGDTGQLLTFEW